VAFPSTHYRGLDVLDLEPNAAHTNDTAYRRSLQKLDPGPGALLVIDRSGVATLDAKAVPFMLESRQLIADFLTFLSNRKGRLRPFWYPTWQADLALSAPASAGGTAISIVDTGYTRFQFTSAARRDLAIIFLDGSGILYHRVLTSIEVGGGSETLGLEVALERNIAPATVLVSFLPCSRLAVDDTPEFRWETTDVVEATLQIQSLPGDTPA
jgi:phage baseplate assembly protein gpV